MAHQLFWAKAHPDVIIPTKREEDGGYDIYARFDGEFMTIPPFSTKLIPTDLHCAFNKQYIMFLKERGSTGTKSMIQHCGVIDSGFRGKIFVPIGNPTHKPMIITKETGVPKIMEMFKLEDVIIYPYNKAICQAVMILNSELESKEISLEELLAIPSERGVGELGSSGK